MTNRNFILSLVIVLIIAAMVYLLFADNGGTARDGLNEAAEEIRDEVDDHTTGPR